MNIVVILKKVAFMWRIVLHSSIQDRLSDL